MKKIDVSNVDYIYLHEKDDNNLFLKHYDGKLRSEFTPKSVQLQKDAHTAFKMISIVENKPIRETINDVIENYIQNMPSDKRNMIVQQIIDSQKSMPKI